MSEAYDLFEKARVALSLGYADEAIVPLQRAKKLEPNSCAIREALGVTYLRVKFYDLARIEFEEILEREPHDDYARFCLALACDKLGMYEYAAGQYKLAVALKPGYKVYQHWFDAFLKRRHFSL